jgi:hypothetical protein
MLFATWHGIPGYKGETLRILSGFQVRGGRDDAPEDAESTPK